MASSVPTHAPRHVGSTLPHGAAGGASGAPPARQLGPYLLQRELGRGSYGAVFLARHAPSGREVALKVLLGAQDQESVERFRREAAITARLQSPAIVRTLDVGFDGKHPFYAMDYCPGPTLKDLLRAQGPQPPREAATLIKKLAEAAAEAHQWGVIHRDLKPANVILTEPDREPKITDFGLARDYAQERLTHTGDMLGTPAYMAPEQFRGERSLDHRVDIYALGVILYQLLTGQIPYSGSTIPELGRLVEAGQATPPRSLAPQVPAELDAVCLKAMAADPNQRFVTASALAQALAPFCAEAPGQAPARRPRPQPPTPSGLTRLLPWAGWVAAAALAAVSVGLARAPGAPPPVADAPVADAAPAPPPSVLADALAELELMREEPVPTETLVRQLRRARGLSSDKAQREALAAELEQLERATKNLDEVREGNLRRRKPEFVEAAASALRALLDGGLPPLLTQEAQAALQHFAAREEVVAKVEAFEKAAAAGVEPGLDALVDVLQSGPGWYRVRPELEAEALEGVLPGLEQLAAETEGSMFGVLRGLLLTRLGRGDEAAAVYAELKGASDLDQVLHGLRESNLFAREEMFRAHHALGVRGRGPRGFGRGRH